MILADKIIEERKKNGWTQEDLAQKLGVSRQSVSKWESAGAIPDLKKIIQLADLFGVSTDYLLKDEVEKVKEQPNQYSLILMDIMMPKMNGDEAAKCIRKINPSIPIVAMSAQSEYSIDQTIMNDSISKPIDEQKLNHILSKYVS